MELFETLSNPWAIRAILASSMVGVMCGMIGCFIVLRHMSMIGDALSHSILPGVYVAFLVVGYSTLGFFVGSVIAGLITAYLITWIQQNVATKNDAAIGIVFTTMFSIGVMGISSLHTSGGGAHLDLKDFLFGSIFAVSNEDVLLIFMVMVYTLISIVLLYRYLFITTFQPTIASTMGISVKAVHYFLMLLLSFAVVSAMSTVGVILVVAMLITPAATALLISDRLKVVLAIAAIIGLVSSVLGMIISILVDTTPGPAMVIVAATIYFLTAVFSPKKGFVFSFINRKKQENKIAREDILRFIHKKKPSEEGALATAIAQYLGLSLRKVNALNKDLILDGLLSESGGRFYLTAKGVNGAEKLVRAHRLWESYQVETMGLGEGQIHDEADRLEHWLDEDILDEVDAKLGFPKQDPHGSPIPEKSNIKNTLLYQKPKSVVTVSKNQMDESVESDLWEMGILPSTKLYIDSIHKDHVLVRKGDSTLEINAEIAKSIKVD